MPFIDHNPEKLVEILSLETNDTRRALNKLRHAVQTGHLDPPPERLLTELALHGQRLANAIRMVTIRHEYVDSVGKPLFNTYENPLVFVDSTIQQDPSLIQAFPDSDRDLYKDLGFTDQEYDDLIAWKEGLKAGGLSLQPAFDYFVDYVLRDLQAAKAEIKAEDVVPAIVGLVGIGVDVGAFLATANVPALVGSSVSGIGAIAIKFSTVKNKLFGTG